MAEENIGKTYESFEACVIAWQGKVPDAQAYCRSLMDSKPPVEEEVEQGEAVEQKSTPLDSIGFSFQRKFYAPPKNKGSHDEPDKDEENGSSDKDEDDKKEEKSDRDSSEEEAETEESKAEKGLPYNGGMQEKEAIHGRDSGRENFGYPKRDAPKTEGDNGDEEKNVKKKAKGPLDRINMNGIGTNYDEGEEDTDTNKQAHMKEEAKPKKRVDIDWKPGHERDMLYDIEKDKSKKGD